ncbi:MAG: hypothetical protein R3C03_14555 [Pirellulaceae bacterium]
MKSNKTLGILLLLLYVCVCTALLNERFMSPNNLQNLLRDSSEFAIIGIGAVLVIVTGGIDLSIGSLIGLVGCTMAMSIGWMLKREPHANLSLGCNLMGWELLALAIAWIGYERFYKRSGTKFSFFRQIALAVFGIGILFVPMLTSAATFGNWLSVAIAVLLSLYLSLHLGLINGLLITKLHLQPFVVTLCGLMCYRGLCRWLADDQTLGFGTEFNDSLRLLALGKPCTVTFVAMCMGIGMMLFGAWRLMKPKASEIQSSRVNGLMALGFGAILALVCSSRYWNGWEYREYGDVLFAWGTQEFRFFSLELPEESISRPARLMAFAKYPTLLAALALLILHVRSILSKQTTSAKAILIRTILPVIGVALGVVGLLLTKRWIGDEAVMFGDPESSRWLGLSTTYWKMIGVFGSMACLIFSVMRIGKSWVSDLNIPGRIIWWSFGFFAVMWMLSMTSIHETVVQTPFFVMAILGITAAVFLTTRFRAVPVGAGNNEEAAKFSGIDTDRMKILAYVLCALCGGIGSVLFTLDFNSVAPSGLGNSYELYAIAAAVLGGCSLRGGEGSIFGVIIGASVMRILYNAPDMIGISSQLELFTVGIVLLIGVIVDETAKRIAAKQERTQVS